MDASVNSSNSSIISLKPDCTKSRYSSVIFSSWFIVSILFLPVFIYVLYIGYQRWRNRCVSMAATHSDVFTFHMVAMELMSTVGSCFYCRDLLTGETLLGRVGVSLTIIASYGQLFFHLLTCVERYLAVIHPITYQGLKQVGGVRIRNISIGCVWLLSVGFTVATHIFRTFFLILSFLVIFLCIAFIFFCSFSVLCVLIRPGPGEVGGNRKLINKSQRRALNTMMTILGALLLKFIYPLMMLVGYILVEAGFDVGCLIHISSIWFNLPSSLVLPLLFLHRAGKLPGCKQGN